MFKFTIRELVLMTTVVALAVGWWLDRREVERRGNVRAAALESNVVGLEASVAGLKKEISSLQAHILQLDNQLKDKWKRDLTAPKWRRSGVEPDQKTD
jgi:hypothetical protein